MMALEVPAEIIWWPFRGRIGASTRSCGSTEGGGSCLHVVFYIIFDMDDRRDHDVRHA